jgi:chaperonin cofactor prefoldin
VGELAAALVLLPAEMATKALTFGHVSLLPEHREQLQHWSEGIHEAWDLFNEHKDEMLPRDRKEVHNALKEERAACNRAWEHLKGSQAQAPGAPEQERERRRRHEEWRARMEARVERLNALIEKNKRVMAKLETQNDELEDEIRSAWNESWAERRRGWVEANEVKIRDMENTNRDSEEEIEDIKRRLRE